MRAKLAALLAELAPGDLNGHPETNETKTRIELLKVFGWRMFLDVLVRIVVEKSSSF